MELIGSNKFELVDKSGKHYKFNQEDSGGISEPAVKSIKTDYTLVFEPLSGSSKSISFRGQIWTLNGDFTICPLVLI